MTPAPGGGHYTLSMTPAPGGGHYTLSRTPAPGGGHYCPVEAEPRPSTSQLLPGRQLHGEAEVGELEESLVVQQDVLGLQVAMDDVPGVEVLDGLQQSPHQAPGRHRQLMDPQRRGAGSATDRYRVIRVVNGRTALLWAHLVSFSLRVTFSVR